MEKFKLSDIFLKVGGIKFDSTNVSSAELEELLEGVIIREHPGQSVEKFEYTETGVVVTLSDGDVVDIEVDWHEIILS